MKEKSSITIHLSNFKFVLPENPLDLFSSDNQSLVKFNFCYGEINANYPAGIYSSAIRATRLVAA